MKTDVFIMEKGDVPVLYLTSKVKIYDMAERERYCVRAKHGQIIVMPTPKGLKPYGGVVRLSAGNENEETVWVQAAFVPVGYKYEVVVS